MVIDSSVLVAILQHEPERTTFFEAMADADRCLVSAVTLQETGQVIFARLGQEGLDEFDSLLDLLKAEIVAHDEVLSRLSIDAFRRFGKGQHPKARLNLGDCAAYALAKHIDAPLLFKGNDFAATDVVASLPVAPAP